MSREPPRTCVFVIAGPLGRADLPGVCVRFGALLEQSGAGVAWCDVRGLTADAVAVDVLARIHLTARRRGRIVRVCHASAELHELAARMGLDRVLGVEPGREAEEREERGGVEEEGELGEPPA
jgi:ABC-type transporter Mla MlaB component